MVEGEWAGRVTGLDDQSVEIAMLVTPDSHSRLELFQFIRPAVVSDHRAAPVKALGYLRAADRLLIGLAQQLIVLLFIPGTDWPCKNVVIRQVEIRDTRDLDAFSPNLLYL